MRANCYQKFSRHYDEIYDRDFYRDYVIFIKKIITERRINKIQLLDAACGTGLFIKEFQKQFPAAAISGFDCSPGMVSIAKKRNKGVAFYTRSFADFRIKEKFNIIVSTFDSINYLLTLSEMGAFFKNISGHLESEGFFIFDFNTNFKILPPVIKKDNITMVNKVKGKFWQADIIIADKGKVFRERHIERLYSMKEIQKLAKGSGFGSISFCSDLNGRKKIRGAARLFVMAQKK